MRVRSGKEAAGATPAPPGAQTRTPSESLYSGLLEGTFTRSGDAIFFIDRDGFIDCNDAALKLFGFTDKTEFLQRHPGDFAPERQPDGRVSVDVANADMAAAFEKGHLLIEWQHQRKDGTLFFSEVMLVGFMLEGREALTATIRDISKRKRAEDEVVRQREALHQSEKMGALGSLLAGVAHEMNNPLSVVLAQTVLMMETATDPKMVARGSKIHTAAERCARIVKSFLAIARQRPPIYAPVAPLDVVKSALEITHYGLGASGISVDIDIDEALPPVWGDGDQLSQVVMNLIVNAQQSLQEKEGPRRLRIAAEVDGVGFIVLRFADNGGGIAPEIRSRIFDPFFTTKPVGKGTGVGLSVCIGIVQAHQGSMSAEETPGGGATFVVRLPVAPVAGASADQGSGETATTNEKAVLIVDDEPEIAQVLAEIIGPLVKRVDVADNGNNALRLLEERRYDLIVSDLRMPDLDGPGLLRRVRVEPRLHDGPLLFVTGDTLYHNLDQFLSESGIPVLEKPFQPRDVRLRVSELLAAAPVR